MYYCCSSSLPKSPSFYIKNNTLYMAIVFVSYFLFLSFTASFVTYLCHLQERVTRLVIHGRKDQRKENGFG